MHTVIYVLLIKIVSDDSIIYTAIIIIFNVRLREMEQNTLESVHRPSWHFFFVWVPLNSVAQREKASLVEKIKAPAGKTTDSTKACGTNVRISEWCGAMSPIAMAGCVMSYFPVSMTKSINNITIAEDIFKTFSFGFELIFPLVECNIYLGLL